MRTTRYGSSTRWVVRDWRRARGQALLELMIAMTVFATALQLTMRTHLWQVTMMQQIDRHRIALRALEARSGMGTVPHGFGDGDNGGRVGRERDKASDNAVMAALSGALAGRLFESQWTHTDGRVSGNGWTVCWRERDNMKGRGRSDMDYEVKTRLQEREQGKVDDVHCESLAVP